jgi:cob(I)alamin adenosyltransferase
MPKIYTRTGDAGETALFAGGRVRKDDLRIESIGTIDGLNAAIGVARMELARGGTAPVGLDELLESCRICCSIWGPSWRCLGPGSGRARRAAASRLASLMRM